MAAFTTFSDGNTLYGTQLNQNLTRLPPIGTILSWLKTYTNTPALPDGWVECSGQVLSDAESVYNGQTIPDLNGSAYLLKGGATSGTASTTAHTHSVSGDTGTTAPASANGVNAAHTHTISLTSGAASATNATYTVVFIIRIK